MEAHYHVCVFSVRRYYGNDSYPGTQLPFNYHLMTIVRKDDMIDSLSRAIQFWFDVIPDKFMPNWVVSIRNGGSLTFENTKKTIGRAVSQMRDNGRAIYENNKTKFEIKAFKCLVLYF